MDAVEPPTLPQPEIKLSAVIPCLNESETIGLCIRRAQSAMKSLGINGEVVVSDNGSSDDSAAIAASLGARVVHQPVRGYGAALLAGIAAAKGKYVIMADADGSYDWGDLSPFVEALDAGYDLVMGNRFSGRIEPGAMPFLNRYVGNPVLSWITRVVFHLGVGDLHCGMRGFTKEAFGRMDPRTPGMEFATEMVVRAHRSGLRITEVPITLSPDLRSGRPHLRPFADGWRHLRFILSHAPNYLYIAPGMLMFILGAVMMAALAAGPITIFGRYVGTHFLALGCLLSYVGFSVVNLGVLSKLMLYEPGSTQRNAVVGWLQRHFTLERGLILGGALFAVGFAIDLVLTYRWLTYSGPMTSSVPVAFVATNLIAIAVNIVFSSFLIGVSLRKMVNEE